MTNTGFTIRRAQQADALAAADVWWNSRQASIPAIPPPPRTHEEMRTIFAEKIIPNRETWLAVSDDGAAVGVMVLHEGWIASLYLEPKHSGMGIGTQLLDLAKERNPGGLDLWAFQSNTGARRFYERHGFVNVAMTDGDNEEGEPDVRYHWPAPESAAR